MLRCSPGPNWSARAAPIEIPEELYGVLRDVVNALSQGLAISFAPHNTTLTIQEAADVLNISRPPPPGPAARHPRLPGTHPSGAPPGAGRNGNGRRGRRALRCHRRANSLRLGHNGVLADSRSANSGAGCAGAAADPFAGCGPTG